MQQYPISRLIRTALLCLVVCVAVGQCEIGWGQNCGCSQACRCDLGARYYASFDTVYESRKIPLIREPQIQRFGLTRSWFNRLAISAKISEIKYIHLQDGTIFIVSSDARLHAVDAEKGSTLWVSELGPPDSICMAPAANSRMVAAVGGNVLYVFNRFSGRLLWQNVINGVAGAGCALSERHVYVPLASGRILAWPLEEVEQAKIDATTLGETSDIVKAISETQDENDIVLAELKSALKTIRDSLDEPTDVPDDDSIQLKEPSFIPLECQSYGLALIQPVVATQKLTKTNDGYVWDEFLAWPTMRGEIYFGCIGSSVKNMFSLVYQVRVSPQAYSIGSSQLSMDWIAPRELSCQLAYSPPMKIKVSEAYEISFDDENPLNGGPTNGVRPEPAKPVETEENLQDAPIIPETEETSEDDFGTDFDTDFGDSNEEANDDTQENPFEGISQDSPEQSSPVLAEQSSVADDQPSSSSGTGEETFDLPGMVIGGSVTGFVVAINDENGEVLWKYVAGHPIDQRMVVVKNHVYACAQGGGMYCLETLRGREIWFAPGIAQFIAESNDYIYCLNKAREIEILDRKTGKTITSFEVIPFDFYIDNPESDRIYLVTKTGLVQCLHEMYLSDPLKHRPSAMDLAAELQAVQEADVSKPGDLKGGPQPGSDFSPDDWGGGEDFGGSEEDSDKEEKEEDKEEDFFGGFDF